MLHSIGFGVQCRIIHCLHFTISQCTDLCFSQAVAICSDNIHWSIWRVRPHYRHSLILIWNTSIFRPVMDNSSDLFCTSAQVTVMHQDRHFVRRYIIDLAVGLGSGQDIEVVVVVAGDGEVHIHPSCRAGMLPPSA